MLKNVSVSQEASAAKKESAALKPKSWPSKSWFVMVVTRKRLGLSAEEN